MRFSTLLRFLSLIFATAILAPLEAAAGFTVSGRQILKDGAPFTVRGVCYNPTPIGDNGFVREPHGDYFTAGYAALQDRDLPLLRAMGANTLRIYGWAPDQDHTAFLNKCYNGGDRPLHVLVNYWIDPATDWNNAAAVQAIIDQYVMIETRLANHPAVLGVIIGNEVNQYNGNGGKTSFWTAMNKVAAAIKARNPSRLVSVAITDALSHVSAGNSHLGAIDFWSLQIYRYPGFGSLFQDYAARSSKPLLLSEYGFDAFNHTANAPYPDNGAFPADVITARWREIVAASSICIGGCVFEWSDEWFKVASGTDVTQERGGFPTQFPDGVADEEWWGLFSATPNGALDLLTPRKAYHALAALWAPVAPPPPPPVASDFGFESPAVGSGYKYGPSIAGYSFGAGTGIAGNKSAFTSGNPAAPEGTQVAFVQKTGQFTMSVRLAAGSYQMTARVANRANYGGRQTVAVSLGGTTLGLFQGTTAYTLARTTSFSVSEGIHVFSLVGQASTDSTLLIDQIAFEPIAATNLMTDGGFESPTLGSGTAAYLYRPATVTGVQPWTFAGSSGIAANGSAFTTANPAAPDGRQVAFLQKAGSLVSREIVMPGTRGYALTVKAAQRSTAASAQQTVEVLLDGAVVGLIKPAGTTYQTFQLTLQVQAGAHVLGFRGAMNADCTALLDQVLIQ